MVLCSVSPAGEQAQEDCLVDAQQEEAVVVVAQEVAAVVAQGVVAQVAAVLLVEQMYSSCPFWIAGLRHG